MKKTEEKIRTEKQNRSIHKYCSQLADLLIEGDHTVGAVMNGTALGRVQKLIVWLDSTPLRPDGLRRKLMAFLHEIEASLEIGELNWTMVLVKENVWRKIQLSMFDIHSTTEISTKQCMEVYDAISMLMAKSFQIDLAWPCKETLSEAQRADYHA